MLTTLRANCIGSIAARALARESSEVIAEVTATFPTSFYIRTFDDELLFVTNRSLKSPITINLDSTSNLEKLLRPHEPVLVERTMVRIGANASIDLGGASLHKSESGPLRTLNPQFAQIQQSLSLVSFILAIIDTNQSVLDRRGLAHDAAKEFAGAVIGLRSSKTDQRFQEEAAKIVGMGTGFTPSGDDMLGGFLAAHNSFAQSISHQQILLDSAMLRQKTSWISGKLLDHMQRLVLDDQLHYIIRSAATGDGDEFILALESVLSRGHTSGIDISVGTILALSLIRDIAFGKKETEAIMCKLGLSS